jgi:phosphate uptake regulator
MIRKVIRQGHNTMTVTLPSDWVRRFNLQGGSQIDISEKDNGLFITTEKSNSNKKIEFDLNGFDVPNLWKFFMAIYREGYDEVLVHFKEDLKFENPYRYFAQHKLDMKYGKSSEKKNANDFIQEMVGRFIGWEIVDSTKSTIIIKEITEPTSKEFDNSLRRVFLLIQQMAEETVEAIKTKNGKKLSHIHNVDINVDKFHDYCIRILNKIGNKDSRKTSLLFSTLFFLELIGDEFKSISHHLVYDYAAFDSKEIEDVAFSIKHELDLYYDLYYKFDNKKVMEMSDYDKGRYFSVGNKKIKKDETKEIFHHLRIIARYINALLELRIEMEY